MVGQQYKRANSKTYALKLRTTLVYSCAPVLYDPFFKNFFCSQAAVSFF
jgi:hypothetical protein